MAMISYAQNAEDVLLERAFAGRTDGFYIDAGANDPVHDSVTKHFSLRGWRGVHIEPIPRLCDRLRADRPRDVTLNAGLSDREGTLTLFEDPRVESWSMNPDMLVDFFRSDRAALIEHTVPVLTLGQVCARYADRPIDFLKIDVECHEDAVIAGGDWTRWRPRVLVVEAAGWETWEPPLRGADYLFAAFDGINRFYVRAEDRELAARLTPLANFTDDFIPYKYLHQIEEHRALLAESRHQAEGLRAVLEEYRHQVVELRAHLERYADLGPASVGVARHLRRLSARFPALARTARRLVRRAG